MAAKVLTMQVAKRPAVESRSAGFLFEPLLLIKIHNAMKISNSTEIERSITMALLEVQRAFISVPIGSPEEEDLLDISSMLNAALYDFKHYLGEKGDMQ